MMNYKEYWEKLDLVSMSKKGKPIYKFRCLLCNHTFINQNNAASHVARCLRCHQQEQKQTKLHTFGIGSDPPQHSESFVHQKEEDSHPLSMSPLDVALIELIADSNIPYTQLNSTPWVEFLRVFNPEYHIPSNQKLREMIIDYSKTSVQSGLVELKNQICGLAVDGATLINKHCYAFLLIYEAGLRLAEIKELKNQNASSLSTAVADVIRKCESYGIQISGVVSDNAAALVKALVDNDRNSPTTLLAQLGHEILRCACSAHTGQLAIVDLMKSDILSTFYNNVLGTIQWLKERKGIFGLKCPYKIPSFISTRWNTLYLCAHFLWENRGLINPFIKEQSAVELEKYNEQAQLFNQKKIKTPPVKPKMPPSGEISDDWQLFLEPLRIIAEFTDSVEQDLSFQQDVFIAVQTALQKLQALKTPIGDALNYFLEKRFRETADISLSKLAYYLTPTGVNAFRSMPVMEKKSLFAELRKTFMKVSDQLPVEKTLHFPAIFRYFFENVDVRDGDSPFYVFDDLQHQAFVIPGVNRGHPVSFDVFASFCKAMVTLPASEAMVERCFSQVKSFATDFNKTMKSDLFIALSSLKLSVRYKRKYYFTKKEFNEEEEDL